ncbi:uncharacterized protein P174DRAFT_74509 [Aspergillus novofumigatus IBT 16806]|uniref:Uncharacterized protein n=1 Tax=Aspergillus novofumigatus (strain IBT 16806) TaxID=1392255 RepID=A0A2I1BSJ7_ASPN1|nr:uncharacterized protein P174DRAFT_74509 [Aspergillus novofumigatus IBT 16806]PKX88326.1 hypothetical protein P174DRAFT_74509 [Aspergillus novofumigatus IBT 16806]
MNLRSHSSLAQGIWSRAASWSTISVDYHRVPTPPSPHSRDEDGFERQVPLSITREYAWEQQQLPLDLKTFSSTIGIYMHGSLNLNRPRLGIQSGTSATTRFAHVLSQIRTAQRNPCKPLCGGRKPTLKPSRLQTKSPLRKASRISKITSTIWQRVTL